MSEIDVSKCAFGGLNMCKSPINKYDIECDKVPIENCYYKQLQQLKEHCKFIDETNRILYQEKVDLIKENEELKKKVKFFDGGICDCTEKAKLAEENEELRKQLKEGVKVKMEWISDACKVCTFKQENKELRRVRKDLPDIQEPYVILYRQLKKKLYSTKQKLEKIKSTCNFDIEHQGYATPTIDDILQIIEGD